MLVQALLAAAVASLGLFSWNLISGFRDKTSSQASLSSPYSTSLQVSPTGRRQRTARNAPYLRQSRQSPRARASIRSTTFNSPTVENAMLMATTNTARESTNSFSVDTSANSFPFPTTLATAQISNDTTPATTGPSQSTPDEANSSQTTANTLTCPICLDVAKNPVVAMCGHLFCESSDEIRSPLSTGSY
jgi:hypothetical protein